MRPAQNVASKAAALPAGIADWNGEDSSKILSDPVIKVRLRKLLGKAGYASVLESFETLTSITKDGNVLFASDCSHLSLRRNRNTYEKPHHFVRNETSNCGKHDRFAALKRGDFDILSGFSKNL